MRRLLLCVSLLMLLVPPSDAAYDRCGSLSEADRESRSKQNLHSQWEWDTVHNQLDDGTLTLQATGSLSALGLSVEIYAPPGAEAAVGALSSLLAPIDASLRETQSSLPHPDSSASYSSPRLRILLGALDSPINQAVADCPFTWDRTAVRGECTFVVHRSFWQRADSDEMQFTAAHELYHIAQMLIWPDVYQCESFWWVEGTAEWFANRALPGQTYSGGFLRRFDQESADSSLLGLHYAATAFWFWAAEEYENSYPMHMGVWGNDGLDDAKSVGESLPPEAWHNFLETYLGGDLRYPDGRPAIPDPYLGEIVSAPWLLQGPAMSFPRMRMQHRAGEWELEVKSQGASLLSFEDEDSWFRLNIGRNGSDGFTHEFECPPEPLLQAAVGIDGTPVKVTTTINDGTPDEDCRCLEPVPEDHCMIGTWQAESTDLPDRMNSNPMSPSRWTGQDMGINTFTFNADGTFSQLIERESVSDFRHQSGGTTMDQTVTVMITAFGRWSVLDEIEMEICKESFRGEMMNTIRVGGREQTTGPHPIPADEETTGAARYRYVCRGDTADVTLMVGDQEFASWRAKRIERSPVTEPH